MERKLVWRKSKRRFEVLSHYLWQENKLTCPRRVAIHEQRSKYWIVIWVRDAEGSSHWAKHSEHPKPCELRALKAVGRNLTRLGFDTGE